MIDSLLQLGFSRNDAEVYSALVEVGPCFVAPLVEQTKKHRQMVYNALETLADQKLISVSQKNGKNFYTIADPRNLLVTLQQKEATAQSLVTLIEQKQKTEFCPTCGKAR